MALLNSLRVLTVVSLVVLNASFDALPVNALAVERAHVGRALGHAHAEIAKKRDSSKRCRPRPSSTSHAVGAIASPTHTTTTTTTSPPYSVPSSNPSQSAHTTTSSQSPSTSIPSSSGGSKILLPWSNNEQDYIKNFVTSQTYDIYSWKAYPYPLANLGPSADIFKNNLRFVPTIYDAAAALDAGKIPSQLSKKGPIKTYNEPELAAQGNVEVNYGYKLWMQFILPLANQGYELIAPSITTGSEGLKWIAEFVKLCNGKCGYSAMDIHIYTTTADVFVKTVTDFHTEYKYPLWVSETACQDYSGKGQWCSQDDVNAYYHGIMEFALGSSFIEKIGYFGLFTAGELSANHVNGLNTMFTNRNGGWFPNDLGNRFIHAQS